MSEQQTWTIDGDEYVLATGDDAHEASVTNLEVLRNGTIYADKYCQVWRFGPDGNLHVRSLMRWRPHRPTLYTLRRYGPFRALTKVAPTIPGGFTVGQKVRITRNVFIDPEGQESATGHYLKGLTGTVSDATHAPAQQRGNVFVRTSAIDFCFAVAHDALVPVYEAGDEVPAEHITHLPDGTLLRQRNPEANSGWLITAGGELRRIYADGALGIGNYSAFTFEDVTWTVTWTPEATS